NATPLSSIRTRRKKTKPALRGRLLNQYSLKASSAARRPPLVPIDRRTDVISNARLVRDVPRPAIVQDEVRLRDHRGALDEHREPGQSCLTAGHEHRRDAHFAVVYDRLRKSDLIDV